MTVVSQIGGFWKLKMGSIKKLQEVNGKLPNHIVWGGGQGEIVGTWRAHWAPCWRQRRERLWTRRGLSIRVCNAGSHPILSVGLLLELKRSSQWKDGTDRFKGVYNSWEKTKIHYTSNIYIWVVWFSDFFISVFAAHLKCLFRALFYNHKK